jgi:RNA polymerase sigma-70 factor, ECF subfamily
MTDLPASEPPPSPPDDPAASAAHSDMLLVERAVAGDQRAFELLVIKYQRRIQRLIGRMVRDVDLVEDIAQETFIRAYRALHQFRGDAQFYTWLYRIAVNTAKKFLMDLKRNPVLSESALRNGDDEDETSRHENEQTTEETPESELAARQIAAVVNAAMEALPARWKG